MNIEHHPVVFTCESQRLLGIIEQPSDRLKVGVLIVTGGPQYRVGSHRQFVLIARAFASAGIPTMRFDYRGMGDAEGAGTTFDRTSADIGAALDCFFSRCPVERVVLWGLCDAASACLMYGFKDRRVASMILLNPWVRSDAGLAKAYVRHYYLRRVLSANFWRKLVSGRFSAGKSLGELSRNIQAAFDKSGDDHRAAGGEDTTRDFRDRMLQGLREFPGSVLILTATEDLTAAEFLSHVRDTKEWSRLMKRKRVVHQTLDGMDHTFSRSDWRQRVIDDSLQWILSSA